jgi:hypothetical protein
MTIEVDPYQGPGDAALVAEIEIGRYVSPTCFGTLRYFCIIIYRRYIDDLIALERHRHAASLAGSEGQGQFQFMTSCLEAQKPGFLSDPDELIIDVVFSIGMVQAN